MPIQWRNLGLWYLEGRNLDGGRMDYGNLDAE